MTMSGAMPYAPSRRVSARVDGEHGRCWVSLGGGARPPRPVPSRPDRRDRRRRCRRVGDPQQGSHDLVGLVERSAPRWARRSGGLAEHVRVLGALAGVQERRLAGPWQIGWTPRGRSTAQAPGLPRSSSPGGPYLGLAHARSAARPHSRWRSVPGGAQALRRSTASAAGARPVAVWPALSGRARRPRRGPRSARAPERRGARLPSPVVTGPSWPWPRPLAWGGGRRRPGGRKARLGGLTRRTSERWPLVVETIGHVLLDARRGSWSRRSRTR